MLTTRFTVIGRILVCDVVECFHLFRVIIDRADGSGCEHVSRPVVWEASDRAEAGIDVLCNAVRPFAFRYAVETDAVRLK